LIQKSTPTAGVGTLGNPTTDALVPIHAPVQQQTFFPETSTAAAQGPQTAALFNDLLNCQREIAQCLESAYLAIRGADLGSEVLAPTGGGGAHSSTAGIPPNRALLIKLRNLGETCFRVTAHSAYEMVLKYGNTAARVRQDILPDLALAVDENCPELASAFLEQIHEWVLEMKEAGGKIEEQYQALSRDIRELIESTSIVKAGIDKEIVRGSGRVMQQAPQPIAGPEEYKQLYSRLEKLVMTPAVGSKPAALMPSSRGISSVAEDAASTNAQVLEMLFFTPQLQLTASDPGPGTDGGDGGAPTIATTPATGGGADSQELLGRPSVCSASELESINIEIQGAPSVGGVGGATTDGGPSGTTTTNSSSEQLHRDSRVQQVRKVSAVALVRAVAALRKVDDVLQRTTGFWTHLSLSTSQCSQMRDALTKWIGYASTKERLRERLLHRLDEYSQFWTLFEACASAYCSELKRGQETMFRFLSEMETRADCLETVKSILAAPAKQIKNSAES